MNFFGDNIERCGFKWWLHKLLPWVVGFVIFWCVSYTFFAPQFEGKSLGQNDIAQYSGMSADIRAHREATGEDPQWTGAMFSGMPAYMIDVEYPTQDVKQSASGVAKIFGAPMNMILFAMIFMMVAVVLMGVNPWIGIIAGLAYGLSTYFFLIIDAGHITKMWALVYAPPLVGAVWYALRKNVWVGSALAALFGSLELGANHPQITYYFLFACIALWISEFVFSLVERRFKRYMLATAMLLVAALLAVGSNFAPLYYAFEHKDSTSRGGSETVDAKAARQEKIEYNTMWSYGKAESFNMLVPNYMGSSSMDIDDRVTEYFGEESTQDAIFTSAMDDVVAMYQQYDPTITYDDIMYYAETDDQLYDDIKWVYQNKANSAYSASTNYWGDQPFTAGPTYLGAVVIFLAIVGLVLAPNSYRWWLLAVSLFMLLLAWGSNAMGFYEVMYDILPGYRNFRTVSMALVVVEWSVPLFAAIALWRLISTELSAKMKYIALGVAGVVVVLLVAIMAIIADYGMTAFTESLGESYWVEQLRLIVEDVRSDAFMWDAIRSLAYVAVTAIAIVAYIILSKSFGSWRHFIALGMLGVVTLLVVCDLGGVDDRYINDEKWSAASPTEVVATKADNDILRDRELGFRVFDTDYAKTKHASNFHRSVDGYHGAKLQRYDDVLQRYIYDGDTEILAMLNTKYIIKDKKANETYTFGPAWFVEYVEEVKTPAEELDMIGGVDLATTAVVNEEVKGLEKFYDATGDIELVEYAPNYLKYEYTAPAESLCVFSEIYYPDGWTAYVDGKEVDYFSVNYILRGMVLPEGEHTVEWRFRAPNWTMANTITGIASWLIILSLVAVAALPLYKRIRAKKCKTE
jgi:hypothetical protein